MCILYIYIGLYIYVYIYIYYDVPDADKIPIVSVVLQGGPDTIRTVHSTIMEGTPVVIFEVCRHYFQ